MALRAVPLVKAGKHWWTHEIVVRNQTGQVLLQDWLLRAIQPVPLGILPQVVLAAVADQGKRSALRANNGDPIPQNTEDLAVFLLADNAECGEVHLCFRGWGPDVAELLGCGSRFIILERLGWRRRTTFHSIALRGSTRDGALGVRAALLLTLYQPPELPSLMPPLFVYTLLATPARLDWTLVT